MAVSVRQNSHGAAAVAGYALFAVFAACWLVTSAVLPPNTSGWRFWAWYALLVALAAAEVPFARAAGFVLFVFITILTVARLGARSAPVVAAMSLAALLVPVAVGSWHVSLAKSFADVTPVAIPVVALTMFAVMQVVRANQALAQTRAELARLAAENERIRIARDLHDLLGHSLTTITVKAGLARRSGRPIPRGRWTRSPRSRICAAGRSPTSGPRCPATARSPWPVSSPAAVSCCGSAGITADLPTAIDVVDPAHQELFGWAVREGLTNVIRHSRARSCAVRVSAPDVEIIDDGHGSAATPGNGLRGLRERAAAAGGGVDAGPVQPAGWRLRVRVPAVDAPPAAGGTAPAARDTGRAARRRLLPAVHGR